jgi:hypothetical protein
MHLAFTPTQGIQMKVFIATDQYATCDKCDGEAQSPDNPIIQIGSFLTGFVWLHKSCFDAMVKGVGELFAP